MHRDAGILLIMSSKLAEQTWAIVKDEKAKIERIKNKDI
jgi:hypothetical protein